MTTVKNISDYINEIAPYNIACSWDNCGLLVGKHSKEVKAIAVTLDLTLETLRKAKETGADLIVTHHPAIFHAKKSFLEEDVVFQAAVSDVSVISAHTCFDCADGGVNDVLASILELKNVIKIPSDDCTEPMVRAGELETELTSFEFAKFVAEKLNTTVRLVNAEKKVKKVAVCGGAGMSFMADVLNYDVDAYVTGEIKHNEMIEAKENGLSVVAAGHFETEYPAMKAMKDMLEKNFSDVKVELIPQSAPVEYVK